MKTIDYTKMRKGILTDSRRRIEVCPNCGRKGEAAHYKDGSLGFAHKAEGKRFWVEVTDHCFIKNPQPTAAQKGETHHA